ncbi:MAG: sigma-70 family RNA polymerase sigma factor [Chitinophagaceae bacterium]|nr:sigma-70 family RNA polymerase sigma factor [Chitinophagaceae bacterium]
MNAVVSDTSLLLQLQADNTMAFESLYWKYHTAVYANVLKITRNRNAAEDIVQEVFFTLWEKRHSLNPDKNIAGWLFTLSFHKSIDSLKKALREPSGLPALVDLPDDKMGSAGAEESQALALRRLEEAMARLSPQKRKVLELCKLQGKSYEEAAREMHISKYTVKEYLSGAVVSIREYLRTHSFLLLLAALACLISGR